MRHGRIRKGFTVIEVLIVLAIAGLIMLIVFLAVPTLARAARNTQRKTDISAIAAALANYADNNGGLMPNYVAYSTINTKDLYLGCGSNAAAPFINTIPGAGGGEGATDDTDCNTSDTNYETARLQYYDPSAWWGVTGQHEIWITSLAYAAVGPDPISISQNNGQTAINSNSILIVLGVGCNSTNTFLSTDTVNAVFDTSKAAVLYVTESGNGNGSMGCLEAS